jgi:hypothetical protein
MNRTLPGYLSNLRTLLLLALLLPQAVLAQVNYTALWESSSGNAASQLLSWTGSGWARVGTGPCTGLGSARSGAIASGTNTFTSPSLGTAGVCTQINIAFNYKVTQSGSAGATAMANPWGSIQVQRASASAGPWTTVGTIDATNHVAAATCAARSYSFTPGAGAVFVRFLTTWQAGSFELTIDDFTATEGVVSNPYCAAGATSLQYEKISRVQLANIDQSSTSTAGYENFTCITGQLEPSASYPFTVTISNPFAADRVLIWVDLNQNNTFDAEEQLFASVAGPVSGQVTGSIAIPGSAFTGNTRMRIRLHDSSAGPNATPCGNSTYGQVEDYTVNIMPPACPIPTGIAQTGATLNSISVGWNAVGGAASYNWEVRTSGSPGTAGAVQTGTTATTTFTAGGLNANTTYFAYVRSNCGPNGLSNWSAALSTFTGYCAAGATTIDEKIQRVTMANIDNISTANVGYENFTNITGIVDLGAVVPFSINLSPAYTSDQVLIWVDLNQNLVFEASELLFSSVVPLGTLPLTGNIVIPNTALPGITRMRIRLHDTHNGSSYPNTPNSTPCGNSTYGQVEDYSLSICAPIGATATVVDDCTNTQFSVAIDLSQPGTHTIQYSVNGGTTLSTPYTGTTTTIGPFAGTAAVNVSVTNASGCTQALGALFSNCPVAVDCDGPIQSYTHCYTNNDPRTFTFIGNEPGRPLVVKFLQPSPIAAGDGITFYDGLPGVGNQITLPTAGGDLSSLGNITSTGEVISFIIQSNSSGSCADGGTASPWDFQVRCQGCTEPEGDVIPGTTDCAAGTFTLQVDLYELGLVGATQETATTAGIRYTVNNNTPVSLTGLVEGLYPLGPFPIGSTVNITLLHQEEAACHNNLGNFVQDQPCPPANDQCANAVVLPVNTPTGCPSNAIQGTTALADQSGTAPSCASINSIQDVWYTFNSGNFLMPMQLNLVPLGAGQVGVELFTACGTATTGCLATVNGNVNLTLAANTNYWLRVFTRTDIAAPGTFAICLSGSTACTGAITIPSAPVVNQALVCQASNALNDTNVPAACGGASNNFKNGVEGLYTFTPAESGTYRVTYTGGARSAILVYSGACPNAGGTCVGGISDNNTSKFINVTMNAGTLYYIWFDTNPNFTASACPGTFSLQRVDCLGVVGGPALPGTACNDNNACTTNDTWNSNCQCVGVLQPDSDGDGICDPLDNCPNTPGVIGTACNDNDPCTINDVINAQCACAGTFLDSDGDGTCDTNDGCPNDPNKIAPGICGCGVADTDTDSDGTADCNDGCPNDPLKISPGQCGCGVVDADGDGDGTADCNDGCPNDPLKTSPGQCGCGNPDTDSDGDGVADCVDNCPNVPGVIGSACNDNDPCTINDVLDAGCNCAGTFLDSDGDGTCDASDGCPNDPNKIAPGICGCGVADSDTDSDGTADCNDGCPNDPLKTSPGQCGCGLADTDSDGDGTADCNDGCPNDPNKTAAGQCGCGVADTDTDSDGTADCNDGCPNDPNKIAQGICGCGVADTDTDSDGTADCNDGCPNDPNKIAPGICGCGVADSDTDSDGTADCNDGCPLDANKTEPGICGCGVADTDSDGDGTADCNDGCPNDPNKTAAGQCGCGVADTDTDGDGTADCNDQCPGDPNKTAPGSCGCGNPEPGATCNDGNPATINDVIGIDCLCSGTPVDCNGDANGTAFLDNCNTCVGGNTNLTACVQDCNGVYGGTAFLDNCNTCVGGNTNLTACVQDCNNVYGGTAFLDNCNTCVGGNTNLTACVQDCNGVYGGTAFLDNCNTCVGGNTNLTACVQDCNGDFGGTAVIDNCGTCVGGNTNIETLIIKTVPNPLGGGSIYEINGEDKPVLELVRGGVYTFDQSDVTNGNHPIAFRLTSGTSYTDGVVSSGTPGQLGANTVFTVPFDAPNDLQYYCVVHPITMGNSILVASVADCVQDCNGDFGGTAVLDNCGTCVGGNTGETACVQDCNGDYGGTAFLDNCSTCVGGNTGETACGADCNGTFGGSAFLDNCNTCVGGTTNLSACVQDCSGEWGGTAAIDGCGTCSGGSTGIATNSQCVELTSSVMLDGPYNTLTGLMRDDLRTGGHLPLTHPYGVAPWSHSGTEAISPAVLAVTGDDAIVDWILLELRSPVTPATVVSRRAALLQRDGDIVDVDGVSPVRFNNTPAGSYHLAVRHRNHLGIMTSDTYVLALIPTSIDLTQAGTATYGTDARRSNGSAMTMWPGNANPNSTLTYSGSNNDRTAILNQLGAATYLDPLVGYHSGDVNMNGQVTYSGSSNDRTMVLNSLGASTYLVPRVEQLP